MNRAALIPSLALCVAAVANVAIAGATFNERDGGTSVPETNRPVEVSERGPSPPASALPFQTAPADAQPRDPRRPATLRRLVRHFDFEEAEKAPYEMPLNFYRYGADASGGGATAQGFPPFGSMRLTDEVAYSGRWSFEFDLDGGSLAARVPTAVIPVMPLADYVVAVRMRTEGLVHSRAQLSAWLHDAQGNPIAASRVQSKPITTDGQWQTVSVHVRGRFENAADLVLELALLQPRHWQGHSRGAGPLIEDVRGRAWFDDVTIWHVPRVELSMSREPQSSRANDATAALTMTVFDVAHDELDAHLRVFDLDGALVANHAFPAPRSQMPRTIEIALPQYGWYSAALEVRHGSELTARRTLDFLHMPSRMPRGRSKDARSSFTIALAMEENWPTHAREVPRMAALAGAGAVILPIMSRAMSLESAGDSQNRMRSAIEQLRRDGVEIVFGLSSMPDELARQMDITGNDVFSALKAESPAWRRYLDEMLDTLAFAPGLDRWQLGPSDPSGNGEAYWHDDLESIISKARRELSHFTPAPHISVPLRAEQMLLAGSGEDERLIIIPHALRPDAISAQSPSHSGRGVGVRKSPSSGQDSAPEISVLLDLPPDDLYPPRERVDDVAMRVLHAWRSGVQQVAIPLPWRAADDSTFAPDPIVAPLRTLAAHLDGRRFAGELALGPGLHAWILEGESADDAALVVWRDHGQVDTQRMAPSTQHAAFAMQLAETDVRAVDLFGNARTISPIAGEHTVRPDTSPMFIEGISGPLVKFRGSFALDPAFVTAELRVHEHSITLRNPWDMPISGTIQLTEDPQWRITPRSHEFTIPARGSIALPVQIVLDRNIIAGRKPLRAEVSLSADGNYRLDLEADIEVGLEDVDIFATWQIVPNIATGNDDLVITQYVRNSPGRNGTETRPGRAINADAFLMAPGVRQQRRLISGLEPGDLAMRSFRIPNGAELLAGKTLRLGLASRDTAARLNLTLEIPQSSKSGFTESTEFTEQRVATGTTDEH